MIFDAGTVSLTEFFTELLSIKIRKATNSIQNSFINSAFLLMENAHHQ